MGIKTPAGHVFTSGTVAAFYHQDIQPGSRHDQCGNATGNARTDHNGIKFLVFLRHPLFCPSVVVILKKYSRSVQVLFHYASQPLHKQVYTPGKLPTLRINQ